MRANANNSDGILRGNNKFFLILLVSVIVLAGYIAVSPNLRLLEKPVCQCNCNCGDKSTDSSTVVSSNPISPSVGSKVLAIRSASVSDAEVSDAWRPKTHVQSYQPSPKVISAAGGKSLHHQFVRAAYPPVGPEKGSIWDSSWYDTPVGYGTKLVPAKKDDGFPSGFVPRPACQAEIDAVQNYIYQNQHPENCKTKKLLVRRHLPGYGLFAGLGLSSNYLFVAAVLGRTLVDLSPNTYFTGNCPSEGLDCAFLPVTHCTRDDFTESEICYDSSCWNTARVISIDRQSLSDYLPCAPTEFPKGRCHGPTISHSLHELLPELKGFHGEHFFQTEFSRYLTRPNEVLSAFTADHMAKLNINDQLISVHIRHGDKLEGIQFPTISYSNVVKRVIQITGIKTVFIGTDDKSVYEELPRHVGLPDIRYVWLDDPNPIVFSADQARGKGKNTIGMFLMAQTIIFSQSAAYIGTRTSNAGQIVYALQQNDCTKQKIAYDMYGDLFYNSWYCRNDIVHAGREWMCALQKPAQGSLIWQWGGAKTECP